MPNTTTNKPLRFSTEIEASDWLRVTANYGLVHGAFRDFIIIQFADDAAWAFTAPDEMVLLPEW